MTRVVLLATLLVVSACRVEDLDLTDKQCPCVAGWRCAPATDTCVRAPITEPDDGGGGDRPDGVPGSSCLGTGGAPLYASEFADLIGWVTVGGAWAATSSEAVQSQPQSAHAYPAGTGDFAAYHAEARMRRLDGAGGALGLALRIQPADAGRYRCIWEPAVGGLRLQYMRLNGLLGDTVADTVVDLGTIAGYDPAAPVVLEVLAESSTLRCCVRDLAGASITGTDTRYPTGGPGLETVTQAAAFDDFRVAQP